VADRDAFAFHGRPAGGGGVQQQIDQMVVQQIDFVDVEDAAVRGGQQPRLVAHLAGAQSLLEVQGADDAVLGRAHGELDQPSRPGAGGRCIMGSVRAGRIRVARIAAETAALDHGDRRQDVGQRAHHGGLGGALLATDQDPADLRRDGGQDQREGKIL
jgi:hypothetical protein